MKDPGLYFVEGAVPETRGTSDELPPWSETHVVGSRTPRVDAYERVSGTAVYPRDLALPDMLSAAILRCPHAHARVRSVDTSAAAVMPGVRAVLTGSSQGADIPWWPRREGAASRLFDPHCRYEGEEVAAVAAETPYQAWDALRAIRVDYEVLPFVIDEAEALKASAPAIHEGGNRVGEPQVYERGDLKAGFAAADVVLEHTYRTACELHTPMEVHGSVVRWDGNKLTVWDTTQGVYTIQQQVASALKLPLANVRVIGHYMGGGFGSKLETGKYTVIAALLARSTARPVKLFLSREETMLATGNRPANTMTLKAGVKKDGTLTALDFHSLGSGGAYPAGAGTSFLVADLYTCPNVHTVDTTVYINAGRARPMRAPGFPQAAWALEQMIDALAKRIGMDPVEVRLRNIPTVSQRRGNLPYTSTALKACLEDGAKAFGWTQARKRKEQTGPLRRGVGVAASLWAYGGGPPSTVIVKLFADGSANLNMGASDIGTGTKTVMAMVVSEELGVPLDKIQIEHADTGTTQYATASGGSKTVPSDSPAVRAAAVEVRRQLLAMAADELKVPADQLVLRDGVVVVRADPTRTIAVTAIPGLDRQQVVVGIGLRGPNVEGKIIDPFAAHFVEVEVNTRTGEVRVVRMVAAQDSGRVMDRLTFDNQVFGGVAMGIGFGLTEQRVLDNQTGKVVSLSWHDYKVPTAMDVPDDQAVVPVDPHDSECNATGAKGLGEPATIPTAAAIANAIYDAVGVRPMSTPASPVEMCGLFAAAHRRG
jgi:CO/xanthine dehydrogenase Mo-binding subunit